MKIRIRWGACTMMFTGMTGTHRRNMLILCGSLAVVMLGLGTMVRIVPFYVESMDSSGFDGVERFVHECWTCSGPDVGRFTLDWNLALSQPGGAIVLAVTCGTTFFGMTERECPKNVSVPASEWKPAAHGWVSTRAG
jgi:hypothetical protein